jgi:hypothetical protein
MLATACPAFKWFTTSEIALFLHLLLALSSLYTSPNNNEERSGEGKEGNREGRGRTSPPPPSCSPVYTVGLADSRPSNPGICRLGERTSFGRRLLRGLGCRGGSDVGGGRRRRGGGAGLRRSRRGCGGFLRQAGVGGTAAEAVEVGTCFLEEVAAVVEGGVT